MAKIRIYELARDLNLTNKDLLLKLKEMDISVASHMSSLEDDTVTQIKSYIRGAKTSELEETRVRPTVIRRRKKATTKEALETSAEAPSVPPESEKDSDTEMIAEVADEVASEIETSTELKESVEAQEAEKGLVEEAASEPDTADEIRDEIDEDVIETKDEAKEIVKDDIAEKAKIVKKADVGEKAKIIAKPKIIEPTEPVEKAEVVESMDADDQAASVAEPDITEKEIINETTVVEEAEIVEEVQELEGEEIDESAKMIEKAPEKPEVIAEPEAVPEEPVRKESIQATIEPAPEPIQEESRLSNQETPLPAEKVDAKKRVVSDSKGEPKKAPITEPTAEKKQKQSGKGKKAKKDTPAKIISLPKRPIASSELIAERGGAGDKKPLVANGNQKPSNGVAVEVKPIPAEGEIHGRDKKKKGKWRTAEESGPDMDKKFSKKKGGGKRKEVVVVEGRDLYSGKAQRGRKGRKGVKGKEVPVAQKTQITTAKAIKRRIKMDDAIMLSELAKRMGIKANEMIAKLMGLGIMATVNQTIDFETAVLVASEFDYEVEKASFEEDTILKIEKEEDPSKLVQRPPVITIMGHVDHGKTSLLDVIRKTRVTEDEAGGITQHIGAYHVTTDKGQMVFLDTPGHEAFSAMRSRGAKVTDIVVLVVAADDGVMPQTVEAINHSKVAKVPIIVAINKMDKADADPARVQRELAEKGLVPEDWGGDTIFVEVSAKQNQGIDDLLEMILLQAEMLELKANPNKLAVGHVVEAKLDSGRGPVATILVQDGTLHTSDPVVCGVNYGKVRALLNDLGKQVKSAGPSIPVEIVGLSGVPMAGDELVALADEKDAKQISMHRTQKLRSKELAKTSRLSLEKLYERMQQGEVKELNLIIKADVDGSIEAIRDSLIKLSNEEVSINVIHSATGTITEHDIYLAAVSDAIIIGFNVRPNFKVSDFAKEENVDIRYHNIIYNVIKEIKDAIVGMMESTFEERVLGRAEVRQIFHVPKVGTIAGCYVTDGKIERGQLLRLLRDGIIVYEGRNSSLRRFKDDVKEVQTGYECGIGIENYNDIKMGDIIESYYMEEIRPEVE